MPTIYGQPNDETILGSSKNDAIYGGTSTSPLVNTGNDTINADAGTDILYGGDGDDSLDGQAGNDTMVGADGNDRYHVDAAGDKLSEVLTAAAGGGTDTVESSVTFTLGNNLDNLELLDSGGAINGSGNALVNKISGNSSANKLSGGTGNDTITGGDGNDTLDGGLGDDNMSGGLGDDLYVIDSVGDIATEANKEGTDTIQASVNIDLSALVFASIENVTLLGKAALTATGSDGDNRLIGNTGANTLSGGGGQDLLDGGAGADSMAAGDGDDTYVVDNAGDKISDSSGTHDKVESAFAIDLTLVKFDGIEDAALRGAAAVALTGDENANILFGNAGANKIDGGLGDDSMDGGKGNDTYTVDNSADQVSEDDSLGGGIDTVTSSASFTLSDNIENLTLKGSTGLEGTGNDLANILTGGGGNDTLDGGEAFDKMAGGKGDDKYVVSDSKDVVTESLTEALGGGVDSVFSSASFLLGTNVDNLTLTGKDAIDGTGNALANELTGNDEANKLSGLAGNDTANGGDGADTVDGGAGDDSLSGGEGDDLYVVDSAGDKFSETGTTTGDELRTNQTLAGALAGIEHYTFTGTKAVAFTGDAADNKITGTAAADSLVGGDGKDTLNGLGGNDTLAGGNEDDRLDGGAGADNMAAGDGDDTYVVDNAGDKINDSSGTHDKVEAVFAIDLTLARFDGIEDAALLGAAAVALTGDENSNILSGNTGANKIDGGLGDDSMDGGKGNDNYLVNSSTDQVSEDDLLGGGIDTVTSSASFTLSGNIENLTLTGSTGLEGTGNDLANILTGGNGDDTLDGGKAVDKMSGGKGDDSYFVDDSKDVVIETLPAAAGGIDSVFSKASFLLGTNVDNLTLIGALLADGTGNALVNEITGNDVANALSGLAGNDTLDGANGDDTVTGGTGNDAIEGGLGTDVAVFVGKSTDYEITTIGTVTTVRDLKAAVLGDDGTDTLTGIENLQFSDKAVAIAAVQLGTSGDDAPPLTVAGENYDGLGGDDTIHGLDGDDSLAGNEGDDVIGGGIGDDLLSGGAGADQYEHAVGDGFDTVIGADQFDNVLLTGTDLYDLNFNRVGNDLVLAAAVDGDYDFADTGSITLKDYYLGVPIAFVQIDVADNLFYGTDSNITTAFITTDITNGLDNTTAMEVIQGSGVADKINGNGGYYDQLFGYGGNDTINGGSGKDFISGGDNNDSLLGGSGVDNLRGGAGTDTLNGGDDTDIVTYRRASSGIVVDLSTGKATNDGDGKQDILLNIENVGGSEFNDKITGDVKNNVLSARDGNDTLTGGKGDDTLNGGAGTDEYRHAVGDGFDTVQNADGLDYVVITTPNLYDLNYTRDGNDLIVAGAIDGNYDFNDTGSITIAGHYEGASIDYILIDTASYNLLYGTDPNIAKFYFTTDLENGNNKSDAAEALLGSEDDDKINGNGGVFDILFGNGGNDTTHGGDGFDLVFGGEGDDELFGDSGNDLLRGDAGNDTIDGGAGKDRVTYINASGGVNIDLAAGTSSQIDGKGNSGNDTLISIERARGSELSDIITGSAGDDSLEGLGGNDSLAGGDGFDHMRGGAGNDTIDGGSLTNDDFVEYDDAPAAVVINISDQTKLGVDPGTAHDGYGDVDTLVNVVLLGGTKFADTMFGSDGRDIFQTFGGNDSVDGGGDRDALDFLESTDGVTVDLNKQGVAQTVSASNGKDTYINVEQLWGSDHNDVLTGDKEDNFIQGRDGDDKIAGGAGFDALEGDSGNDTLTGGAVSDGFYFSLQESAGKDLITDFSKAEDTLSFLDVIEATGDAQIDIADIDAAIDNFVNGGAGKNVTINFENGASILLQGAGTAGVIVSVGDLVADPATQILINSP